MKTCLTCKYWKQITNYKGAINTGTCGELFDDRLTIILKTGWDGGYIERFETESNFGCILYKKK